MVRSPTYDENGMKKGAWSKEEDEKLIAYIQKYGHWNWRQLPKFAGLSRCGKSCRLRWMNYLRPNLKHGNYTKEEEDRIIKLHEELGNKWSAIAAKLPGRTDNEIKNHWHSHLKKLKTSKDNYSSQSDDSNQIEVEEFKSVNLSNKFSNPILESSPLSPETPSNEFCSSDSVSNLNYVIEEGNTLASWETFEDCIGDFWTQPFMTDKDYNQDCISSTFVQDGFQLPYDSYYDDNNVEFFYQVMQQ